MSKRVGVMLIGAVPPPFGGVSVHLQRFFLKNRDDSKFEITVLDLRKFLLISAKGQSHALLKMISTFFRARIIHIHVSRNLKLVIAILSKVLGKKVVYTHHNSVVADRFIFNMLLKWCDSIVLVNDDKIIYDKSYLKKVQVIPAFIEPADRKEIPETLLKKIGSHRHVIVSNCFHGGGKRNLINGKDCYGFDLILSAFSDSCRQGNASETLLVLVDPTGDMKSVYEPVIKAIPLPVSCSITYCDTPVDFASLLTRSALLIRATRSDGDSLAIREALHYGVPVLASDCTRRPAGVHLYETENYSSLSEKITEILQTRQRQPIQNPDFNQMILENYSSLL